MKRIAIMGVVMFMLGGMAVAEDKAGAPSYVKDPGSACWVILSKTPVEKGMKLALETAEGKNKPVSKGSKDAWMCGPNEKAGDKGRYMYFSVTDTAFKEGKTPKVDIIIEYFDEGEEIIKMVYDSSDEDFQLSEKHPKGVWKPAEEEIEMMDSKKWKTAVFHLKDARFTNKCNGQDFRLQIPGGFDFVVGSAAVVKVK